ncbi:hypothetical protein D1164_19860 [Mariniphaga sediminis]|uniref:Uncharacterized protein n=1 Tax=Mariniphaga sediminis TaxID=1628158 RepID=A0A399CWN4_9BACT|nr:hypothetical protein D1164_19860 [Mariniphaga sediminis]
MKSGFIRFKDRGICLFFRISAEPVKIRHYLFGFLSFSFFGLKKIPIFRAFAFRTNKGILG